MNKIDKMQVRLQKEEAAKVQLESLRKFEARRTLEAKRSLQEERWGKLVKYLRKAGCNVILSDTIESITLIFSDGTFAYISESPVTSGISGEITFSYTTMQYSLRVDGSCGRLCSKDNFDRLLETLAEEMNKKDKVF